MADFSVILDPGHGGWNPGAVYQGRREKDDVLQLALDVGYFLEQNGVNVMYTRVNDVYESPAQKAAEGNRLGADFFVSLHRNSSPYPNQYSGVESLVYNQNSTAGRLARNINAQLEEVGFKNLGIQERKNLPVLRDTTMPAVLVEVGFINNDKDNALLDSKSAEIAKAIADGILQTFHEVR